MGPILTALEPTLCDREYWESCDGLTLLTGGDWLAVMEEVFKSFCAFGGDKATAATMDGAKLAKLCRDLKLLDKNLTATDVDIIFSKVKAKTEYV